MSRTRRVVIALIVCACAPPPTLARRLPHPKVGSFFPSMNIARSAPARIPTRRRRPRRPSMPR